MIVVNAAGFYTVTVTNASGCKGTSSKEIIETVVTPPSITPASPVICPSSVVVLDAGSGYSGYIWSTGSSSRTTTVNMAGTYTVTVTQGGCQATGEVVVTASTLVPPVITPTPVVLCPGEIETIDAGSGYSTYVWSTGAVSQSINITTGGTYRVTVGDGECTAVGSLTATNGLSPTPSISPINAAICAGSSIELVADSGYSSYEWSTGDNVDRTTVSMPGTYTVTVTNANGCKGTSSRQVVLSSGLNPSITPGNPRICLGSDVELDAGSGYSTYSWSEGSGSQQITVSIAGFYTVTVTNVSGCSGTTSVEVIQSASLAPVINPAIPSICSGSSVVLDAGNGYDTYEWSVAGQMSQTLTVSMSGTYTVTVTRGGCSGTSSVVVQNVPNPVAGITGDMSICSGQTTQLVATGGSGYDWSEVGNSTNTLTINPTTTTVYTVTVTNNGCKGTTSATVVVRPSIQSTSALTHTRCGQSNGQINLTVSGGAGGYTYRWNPNLGNLEDPSNLAAGGYALTITDAIGCTFRGSYDITPSESLQITTFPTGTLCNQQNGRLDVFPTNGQGVYTYVLPPYPTNTTGEFLNMTSGNYVLTVTDGLGCRTTTSVVIAPSGVPSVTATSSPTRCGLNNNGQILITSVGGGLAPYLFDIGDGNGLVPDRQFDFLPSGNYRITVSDANGCTNTQTVQVASSVAMSLNTTSTGTRCDGPTGTIRVQVGGGGTQPYTFDIGSANQGGITVNNYTFGTLAAGTYTVTVTDFWGCTAIRQTTVTSPSGLTASTNTTNAQCGRTDGSLQVTTMGGSSPFTYTLQGGTQNGTGLFTNLGSGTYAVTVQDKDGCSFVTTGAVGNASGQTITGINTSVAKCTSSTGGLSIQVSGGLSPYTYVVTGQTPNSTGVFTNLSAGMYGLTVTDQSGCVAVSTAQINSVNGMSLNSSVVNTSCGLNNGQLDVSVIGGMAPYTYVMSGPGVSPPYPGLGSGTYSVTVTDANGCVRELTNLTVGVSTALNGSLTIVSATCGQSNGSISVVSLNGGPNYTYSMGTP